MIIPNVIRTISDLRFKTKDVMEKAQHEPVVLFERSIPRGVLLSMEAYTDLVSNLEDYYDSIKAQEFEKEDKKKVKWSTLEDIMEDRKK